MVPDPDQRSSEETRSFRVLSCGAEVSHDCLTEKIGQGGMGVVYKAKDAKLKRILRPPP
jgi:hypothetical protein